MKYSLDTRKEITDLISGEIAKYRAGEIKEFTSYASLVERFGVPRDSLRYLIRTGILKEDIAYRTKEASSFAARNKSPEVLKRQGRRIREHHANRRSAYHDDYLGPTDDPEVLERDGLFKLLKDFS